MLNYDCCRHYNIVNVRLTLDEEVSFGVLLLAVDVLAVFFVVVVVEVAAVRLPHLQNLYDFALNFSKKCGEINMCHFITKHLSKRRRRRSTVLITHELLVSFELAGAVPHQTLVDGRHATVLLVIVDIVGVLSLYLGINS